MKPIIEIQNLGKRYPIVHDRAPYSTLRDSLTNFAKHPFKQRETREQFWALKDVNLDIAQGDIVGIIGKNGAGKSTLLKILSGITKPTEGRIILNGRVSSLLEVGTGFHSELTGRENIFLNGVILGMTRKEVAKKFEQIVEFSGVSKFLDTPVKHYSSGMYVRLAFAIAAHLEPDILIVDEVLAVGDVEFQKKCLGKMHDISKNENRTILLVSHNVATISSLCSRAVLLESGRIVAQGSEVSQIVKRYVHVGAYTGSKKLSENPLYSLISISTHETSTGNVSSHFFRGDVIRLQCKIKIKQPDRRLVFGFSLFYEGQRLYYSLCTDSIHDFQTSDGVLDIDADIPTEYLNVGKYDISFISGIHPYEWIDSPEECLSHVTVNLDDTYANSSPYWKVKRPSLIAPIIRWEMRS